MRRNTLSALVCILLAFLVGSAIQAQVPGEGWTRIGVLYTGDITALAVSPNYETDTTIYLGVAGGGLLRSSDRGESWVQCDGIPCGFTVTGIALPPDYQYGQSKPAFLVTSEGNYYRSDNHFETVSDSHTFMNKVGSAPIPCTSIAIGGDTTFDNNVYVGTWGYGVWHLPPVGGTWLNISPSTPDLDNCRSLEMTRSQVLWATCQPLDYGIYRYLGSNEWIPRTPSALVGADILTIRASWADPSMMWFGSAANGMWLSTDSGASWSAACDGATSAVEYQVRAVRECPSGDSELWEGRNDGMRVSTNLGATCSSDSPNSRVNVIRFSPAYHGTGNYCDAFIGTKEALYRVTCSQGRSAKSPVIVDGNALAVAFHGRGAFMGTLTHGLFKSVDNATMVDYNNFPNGERPEIVAVCLDPLYNEFGTQCSDQTTLFVAANFPNSPDDNGVYKSVNAGNSWAKMIEGQWPSGPVLMRDLAISPAYTESGQDRTLFAATREGTYGGRLYRWDGSSWTRMATDNSFTDIAVVALPPRFNLNAGCVYGTWPIEIFGLPCDTVFISATKWGVNGLWYSLNGGGYFSQVTDTSGTGCPGGPTCPEDITGIAFPQNFGYNSDPSLRVVVSSSTKGVLTSHGEAGVDVAPWVKWDPWVAVNTYLPENSTGGINVSDVAADPDWIDDDTSPVNPALNCAVAVGSTADPKNYGPYHTDDAGAHWSLVEPMGHALSVAFETRDPYETGHSLSMVGFLNDPVPSYPHPPVGSYFSSNEGNSYAELKNCLLPVDVFSTVAHERNTDIIFSASPSMGVFVSEDKGETFRPFNLGKSPDGPCYLTNGYGITMLANRRGLNLDAIYVGTTDGIKSRYTCTDPSTGKVNLDYEDTAQTSPSGWLHSTLSGGGATTGYWERLEVVPNSSLNYPVWAVSPDKGGFTAKGFAALPAGSYEGWVFQNDGLANLNAKGVRLGFGSGSGSVQPLISGSPIRESVGYGEWDYYSIDVTDPNFDLQVFMDNESNDPDLYVRYGGLPTTSAYDFRPYYGGSDETVCVVPIMRENFNESWGPWGNNPPSGWTVYTNEDPVSWDYNNWNNYYGTGLVWSQSSRSDMVEGLTSPVFSIPSNYSSPTLTFYHYYYSGSTGQTGMVWFYSNEHGWNQINSFNGSTLSETVTLDLSGFTGDTGCQVAFYYYDNAPSNAGYWLVDDVRLTAVRPNASYPYGSQQMLKTGTWYIGVRGYANAENGYTLTAALDAGCTGTSSFGDDVSAKAKNDQDTNLAPMDPKAPVGGITWGTVGLTGVVRGTGTASLAEMSGGGEPKAITWQVRNGTTPNNLTNLKTQTIIQLPDTTLVVGCDASATSDKGIWYSPAGDEGVSTYYQASSVPPEGAHSKKFVDVIQASNGDVLMAANGTGSGLYAGGVWLSGDKGRNWMRISQGFDTVSQELADIVADSGTPVSYYASTNSTGLWTRTITASPYPTISAIEPSSGSTLGNTPVTITGTGFADSCPTGVANDCPSTAPVVIFGDTEVTGTWVSATSITATTPAHSTGPVAVNVRNPDTRRTSSGVTYTYSITCETPGGMSNNTATDADSCADTGVSISWSDPSDWGDEGSGTRTFDVLRDGSAIQSGLSSATHGYTDAAGTNGVSYIYSVRANNGCGMYFTTAGATATDIVASSPSGMSNNSAADADICEDTGVFVLWADPSDWGDGGSGTRTFDVLRDGGAIALGLSAATHDYTDTTGTNGVSYTYSVRANNGCSLSFTTAGAAAVDVLCVPPEVAQGSYPDIQSWSGTTQSWPAASRATGYYLYRLLLSDLPNLQNSAEEGCRHDLGASTSHDCSTDDPGGVAGKIYFYMVTGYNGTGEGSSGDGTGFTRNLATSTSCSP